MTRERRGAYCLLALALPALCLAAGTILEQAPRARVANPLAGDRDAARAGAKLFERHCAECHGRGAEGIGNAPSLKSERVRKAGAGALFWVLRQGRRRRGMPSFTELPVQRRWQIVAYLESL